jgi:hypothetical protein
MRGKRFRGKTRGKRHLGKPKYRWDWEYVKMDLESKEKEGCGLDQSASGYKKELEPFNKMRRIS